MHRPPPILHPLRAGDKFISTSNSITNIGVIFDRHIRMDKHISAIVRCSFYSLRATCTWMLPYQRTMSNDNICLIPCLNGVVSGD